jgi:hypothetical protein
MILKRNRLLLLLGLLFVLGFGFLFVVGAGVAAYFWLQMRGGSVEKVAKRLPSDTNAVLVMRGFADLALEFRDLGTPTAVAGSGGPPAPSDAEMQRQFEQTFGFRMDDPQGWRDTGLDFTDPWALALAGDRDPDRADAFILIPVTDGDKATAFTQRVLAQQSTPVQPSTFGTHPGYLIGEKGAFAIDDDYLVLVGADRRDFDPATSLRVFLDRDRTENLAGRQAFKDVLGAVGDDWHMLGYASPEMMTEAWQHADRDARDLFGTLGEAGAGYAMTLHNEALDSRLVLLESSTVAPVLAGGPDPLADHVSGAAIGVARLGFDYKSLWTQAHQKPDTARQLDDLARSMRDDWGVDLQTDIIDNLDGPITLVSLAGEKEPDAVAWVKVHDVQKATGALDAVTNKLRGAGLSLSTDKRQDQSWVFNDTVSVGLAKDSLVMAFGKGRLSTLEADLAGRPTSFTAALPAAVQGQLRAGPPVYAYLDMGQSLKLINDNPLGARLVNRDARKAARAVAGVSLGLEATGKKVVLQSSWHAPEGGFTRALRELMDEQARVAQYQQWRDEVRRNVDLIRAAEVASGSTRAGYLECGSEAEGRSRATASYDWVSDACWSALGWAPVSPVRGGYWVTRTSGWYSSFKVHALVDMDNDGEYAEFTADPYRAATLMTDYDVF